MNDFFENIRQQMQVKRTLSRGFYTNNSLDSSDTAPELTIEKPDYDNAPRAYHHPKRSTSRKAPTEKRVFGYQLPLELDNSSLSNTHPPGQILATRRYTTTDNMIVKPLISQSSQKPQANLFYDVVKSPYNSESTRQKLK